MTELRKRAYHWIFIIGAFSFLLSSCKPSTPETPNPIFTKTQTQQPTLSPVPTSTRTLIPTLIPAFTSTLAPTATQTPIPIISHEHSFSPSGLIFVGDHYNTHSMTFLGGYSEGTWLIPEESSSYFNILNTLDYYSLDGVQGSKTVTDFEKDIGPVSHCNHELFWVSVDSELPPFAVGLSGFNPVSSSAAIENLSPENETYRQFVSTYLIEQGVPTPNVQIERILRVDLENDGVDEVLIEASHFVEDTGHSVSPGDYSLILLRKLSGNSVSTQLVVGDIYFEDVMSAFPHSYFLQALIDVNSDNKTEVFVGIKRWEGNGTILYELNENALVEVLRMFCHL
jgi:hypothetical protein